MWFSLSFSLPPLPKTSAKQKDVMFFSSPEFFTMFPKEKQHWQRCDAARWSSLLSFNELNELVRVLMCLSGSSLSIPHYVSKKS